MSKKVCICVSCDDNYAPHVGTMIFSLLKHSSAPDNIEIYLIDNGVSEPNKALLKKQVSLFDSIIHFIKATEKPFEGLPTLRYGIATYQRLALADLLPQTIEKVIYLDCDIVVRQDISELWHQLKNLESIAAVENFSPKPSLELELKRKGYFNAGVLGVNLNYWREHDVKSQMIDFLNSDAKTIHLDQCALNNQFRNSWLRLDLKWNVQADIFGVIEKYYDETCGYTKQGLINASKNPAIVHFIGKQKPWMWHCYSPYKKWFIEAKKQSLWKDEAPSDDSFTNRLKNRLAVKKHLRRKRLERKIL